MEIMLGNGCDASRFGGPPGDPKIDQKSIPELPTKDPGALPEESWKNLPKNALWGAFWAGGCG